MAADSTNRKMNQNTTDAIRRDGLAPGLTFSTYSPVWPECRCLSRPTFSSPFDTTVLTILAMK